MNSLSLTPFTESVPSSSDSSGTTIEMKFTLTNSDIWDEINDGDRALPPSPPDGNQNFIAFSPSDGPGTGGRI